MKNITEALAEKLIINEVLKKVQMHLMVDFITKLLLVAGKDVILVVCNRLSKMVHFVVMMKGISVKKLFRNNVQKLHRLLESMIRISNREPQFTVELMKELNKMLRIETRLLMVFYLQTDGQMKQINQELKQYLRFFIEYRQRDWPEWLVIAEFVVNKQVYLATKVLPFMANYGRELKIGANIRRKGKIEKATEFTKRMRKV